MIAAVAQGSVWSEVIDLRTGVVVSKKCLSVFHPDPADAFAAGVLGGTHTIETAEALGLAPPTLAVVVTWWRNRMRVHTWVGTAGNLQGGLIGAK